MEFVRPTSLDEALTVVSQGGWRILAGGTDFYPALKPGNEPGKVLDITAIERLRDISRDEAGFAIGAGVTWTDLLRADLPPAFDGLKLAAREIGSVQIQNRATIVGNLCNASPAADGVPPLLTLDAEVECAATGQIVRLPLRDFVLGNRRTALAPDALVTRILVPKNSTAGRSTFTKLGARKYLVISISMVAVRLAVEGGKVADCAISVGACSAVAQRLLTLENDLRGKAADASLAEIVAPRHLELLSPIDDVRSTADYRRNASLTLVRRALSDALEEEVS